MAACSSPPPPPRVAAAPPAPPPLSSTDAAFVQQAAAGGMAEIQSAQLALATSSRSAVKQFAQRMITDHTQNDEQLSAILKSKGATVAAAATPEETAQLTKLQGEKGRAFDSSYLHDEVNDHAIMLQLMKNEAANGTDPDLKAFAAQTATVVQQHLNMAERISGYRPRPMPASS
jgi:putative membrane protein